MTFLTVMGLIGLAFFLLCAWSFFKDGTDFHCLVSVVLACGCAYVAHQGNTDEHKAQKAQEERQAAAKARADATPHVVREADGCKVYAWKGGDDRFHYFTRCPASTTSTESSWQECTGSGKTRSCKVMSETIEVRP